MHKQSCRDLVQNKLRGDYYIWSQCGVQYFIIGITSLSSFTMPFKQFLILAQVAVRVRVICAPVLGDRGSRCKHVVYAASWAQPKQRAASADKHARGLRVPAGVVKLIPNVGHGKSMNDLQTAENTEWCCNRAE